MMSSVRIHYDARCLNPAEQFSAEFPINDHPDNIRESLCSDLTLQQIRIKTGCLVEVGGCYIHGKIKDKFSNVKPLHLLLKSYKKENVERAISCIIKEVNESVSKPKFQKTIVINLDGVDPDFTLISKLEGENGNNLKYISSDTGSRVTLRGKGSSYMEPLTGRESSEPLHLLVECDNVTNGERAVSLAYDLVDTVREEWLLMKNSSSFTSRSGASSSRLRSSDKDNEDSRYTNDRERDYYRRNERPRDDGLLKQTDMSSDDWMHKKNNCSMSERERSIDYYRDSGKDAGNLRSGDFLYGVTSSRGDKYLKEGEKRETWSREGDYRERDRDRRRDEERLGVRSRSPSNRFQERGRPATGFSERGSFEESDRRDFPRDTRDVWGERNRPSELNESLGIGNLSKQKKSRWGASNDTETPVVPDKAVLGEVLNQKKIIDHKLGQVNIMNPSVGPSTDVNLLPAFSGENILTLSQDELQKLNHRQLLEVSQQQQALLLQIKANLTNDLSRNSSLSVPSPSYYDPVSSSHAVIHKPYNCSFSEEQSPLTTDYSARPNTENVMHPVLRQRSEDMIQHHTVEHRERSPIRRNNSPFRDSNQREIEEFGLRDHRRTCSPVSRRRRSISPHHRMRRSPTPSYGRRRSQSPLYGKKRSPSPQYSRRRSPSHHSRNLRPPSFGRTEEFPRQIRVKSKSPVLSRWSPVNYSSINHGQERYSPQFEEERRSLTKSPVRDILKGKINKLLKFRVAVISRKYHKLKPSDETNIKSLIQEVLAKIPSWKHHKFDYLGFDSNNQIFVLLPTSLEGMRWLVELKYLTSVDRTRHYILFPYDDIYNLIRMRATIFFDTLDGYVPSEREILLELNRLNDGLNTDLWKVIKFNRENKGYFLMVAVDLLSYLVLRNIMWKPKYRTSFIRLKPLRSESGVDSRFI